MLDRVEVGFLSLAGSEIVPKLVGDGSEEFLALRRYTLISRARHFLQFVNSTCEMS